MCFRLPQDRVGASSSSCRRTKRDENAGANVDSADIVSITAVERVMLKTGKVESLELGAEEN